MKDTGPFWDSPPPGAAAAAPTAACRPAAGRQAAGVVAAILLAGALAAVFMLHYSLESAFDRLRTFEQYDVLFDTDPHIRLISFAHGWGEFSRNLQHPNLANFVNPPLRFVARVLQLAGLDGGMELLQLRRFLGLLVAPLFSVLQALAVFALFRRLDYGRLPAFLLSLIGAVSFSQLVFGSIPDHFAISGVLLTLAFILAADLLQEGEIRWWGWCLAGWVAAGITLTNLCLVSLLFWLPLALRSRRFARPTRLAVLLTIGVAAVTFASHFLLNLGYDSEPQPTAAALTWTGYFWRQDVPGNLARFPTALADALAPPEPETVPIRFLWPRGSHYRFQFTLEKGPAVLTGKNPLGTFLLFCLVAGFIGHWRGGPLRRGTALAAAAVLCYNWLFHSVWGHEFFLYSQHWLTASLILLAGLVPPRPGRGQTASCIFLLLLAAVVALNNFLNLGILLRTLAAVA